MSRGLFRCPVCGRSLARAEKLYRCSRGHAFDVARQGYVNLLPQRRHGQGDPLEMLRARRSFLEAGHLDRLSDRLSAFVEGARVLDAGCGEGFYLRRLQHSLIRCGVDLSRDAIRLAAQADPGGFYAVGSVYDLPLISGSVDVVLSVFAHRSFREFARALRSGGLLVTVHPGPDHLLELRRLLYADSRLRRERLARPGRSGPLRRSRSERLRYTVELAADEDLANLLAMTPFALYTSPVGRERVRASGLRAVTVDFVLTGFRVSGA